MPWKKGAHVKGKGYPVLKADTGEVVGYSKTKSKQSAYLRALYANAPELVDALKPRKKEKRNG